MFRTGKITSTENYRNSPNKYFLFQNYPNPFNPVTIIKYEIPSERFVTIKVYDVLGSEVKTLVSEMKNPGRYQVAFDGTNLANGMYIYHLESGKYKSSRKMILLK